MCVEYSACIQWNIRDIILINLTIAHLRKVRTPRYRRRTHRSGRSTGFRRRVWSPQAPSTKWSRWAAGSAAQSRSLGSSGRPIGGIFLLSRLLIILLDIIISTRYYHYLSWLQRPPYRIFFYCPILWWWGVGEYLESNPFGSIPERNPPEES